MGWGVESVFRVASLSVFLMFWVTLFFYREPRRSGDQQVASVFSAIKNMFVVLRNLRFVVFLIIFSGFFVIFWQQYISMPLFIRKYVNPNADVDLLLSVDAIIVICFQIAVTYVTPQITCVHRDDARFSHHQPRMDNSRAPSHGADVRRRTRTRGTRRNHSGFPLLRIHLAACSRRTTGTLYGLCISADRNRVSNRVDGSVDIWSITTAKSSIVLNKCGG